MTLKDDAQVPQRRRGAALETALLDAAWDELVEKGYDGFTIDAVAERARTSRAVLYRRWATKQELVRAAVGHAGERQRDDEIPDTGSLRDDVVEVLRGANNSRAWFGITMVMQLSGYYAETGSGLADLRGTLMGGRVSRIETLLARAVERGEADPAKLTPRVVAVPFDLYRQELMMTLKPVPDEVIESIVDEVFMPLVRP
ncbi:TetR/AcrR family transcriptional regulator [Actinoplanes sp. NBRC 103695]|uniref:TetR/AcrR family transcriptional regulator n=1 Tax=Actinoplanes sp. NBRC 103695 TaxID=3032202 RepID=UPI0024A1BA4E|nr:TetR/AcrR family transcriptional regulator [Actinoplanes sp. NBRC 103695]GLY94910.1 TetR family transcriptional regulator [Actinoplanes sp. NBRC 103695]